MLDDPLRKYKCAEQHPQPRWREVEAFEKANAYGIRCDIDEGSGQHRFYRP